MSQNAELDATIDAALAGLGERGQVVERHPSSTIEPDMGWAGEGQSAAVEVLRELAGAPSLSRELELHGTIGEGAMGIVRLGTQRALARQVAVKTLKPEHRSDDERLKLLREGWVTGALEHPNVVPVYDVALEGDGSPLVVLKRIEGTSWDGLMHDARTVRERFGEEDLLEWNVRTLMQVCQAVRFAHSRKVLHRDLKPENVMIGEFGEVYVVDWGIAVSLDGDAESRLPLARNATEMAGTPLYMAPEMLGGPESRLSERSDVYLLGAILYEIVVGRPPRQGTNLMQLVSQIVISNPEIPEGVPEELRAVIERALQRDPEARFASAEELRQALAGFLQHRDAALLAAKAETRLAQLEEALEAQAVSHREGGQTPDDPEALYRLFSECRFGFRHALEVWPQSQVAQDGLRRAIVCMVELELEQGEPEAARTLLTELETAPPELAARVEQARAERREEDQRLRALGADQDPMAGRRTRVFLGGIIGLIWSIASIGPEVGLRMGWIAEPEHIFPIVTEACFLLVMAALGIWARESMMRTQMNRVLGGVAVVAVAVPLLSHTAALLAGGPDAWATFRSQFGLWGGLCAVMAFTVDKRFWVPAAAQFVAVVVVHFYPRSVFLIMSIANEVLFFTVLWMWLRREDLESLAEARQKRLQSRRERRRRRREGSAAE